MSSPLNVYKGPENKMTDVGIEDGQLFFATDTKTIYLDCNFKDGNGELVQGRFPFGGGSGGGIIFAEGTPAFEDTANEFFFELKYLQDQSGSSKKLPEVNSVIFNVEDGYFYRVIEKLANQVKTERLNTVGIGGGGGTGGGATGITASMITPSTVDLPYDTKTMPIIFAARSRQENARLDASLYINGTKVKDFTNIPQSQDFITNLTTIEINDYREYLLQEDQNTIEIHLSDNYGYTYKVPLTWYLTLYQVSLQPTFEDLATQYGPFEYEVVPSFSDKLVDPTIHYQVVYTSQNSVTYPNGRYELSRNTTTSVPIPIPQEALRIAGAYRIDMWLTATIKGGATITSKTLSTEFVYQIAGSEQATIIGNFPAAGTYDLYDTTTVKYRLSYGRSAQVKKSIIIQKEGAQPIIIDNFPIERLEPNVWSSWQITFTELGYYTFKLELLDSNQTTLQTLQSTREYYVQEGVSVPSIEKNNLIINLVPDKLNTAINREEWISKTDNGGTIECKLSGFNWNSNGWENETYKNSLGETKTVPCLHLNNGAKVVIPYNPWSASTLDSNQGAEARGLTIEFDVKIKNIQSKYKRIISCVSEKEDGELYTGIAVNGECFTLNSRDKQPIIDLENQAKRFTDKTKSGLVGYYAENERVHITYVINPRAVAEGLEKLIPTRVAFTYINGVISGIVNYSTTDKFLQDHINQDNVPAFIFDSAGADIYIYNFRMYSTYLDSATVLRNYFATLGDYTEAARRWEVNNLLNKNNELSLSAVKKAGTIPYLVIRGGQQCTEMDDGSWKPNDGGEIGLPYKSKKDYRLIDAYFYDTDSTKNHIGDQNNRAKMIMYPQGTSSLIYPVKNLRIEFIDGQEYSLMEGLPPVSLFTLKADYMESSGSHNTGAANALNKLYSDIGLKTPAQEIDPNYVTAIKGRPIVVFYKAISESALQDPNYRETDDDYLFVGKYNFNLDKATPEPFGFFSDVETKYGVVLDNNKNVKSGFIAAKGKKQDPQKTYYTQPNLSSVWDGKPDWSTYISSIGPLYEYHSAQEGVGSIQCWEVKTNTSDLVRFQQPWHEMAYIPAPQDVSTESEEYKEWEAYDKARKDNLGLWEDAFESRYPEYKEEICADKRGITRLLNWIASTNFKTATNEVLEDGCDNSPASNPHYGFERDTAEYRKQKFISEFDQYLVEQFMSFYYVMTEVNYMIDSRAKNMMLCSFDQDMDAGTGHWFPIFYDMDTQLGIDNEGKIRFLYDDEDYEFGKFNTLADYYDSINEKDNYTFNEITGKWEGITNILWSNFSICFQNKIRDMYLRLRGSSLNEKELLKIYNDGQADAWDEVFCNEDAEYKYLRPFLSGEMTEEEEKEDGSNQNSANRLYASQGTRTLHRSKFIRSRLDYLDSKYQYNGTSRWEMRAFSPANPPANWDPTELTRFTLTAKNTVYVNYGKESDDISYSGKRIEEGNTETIQIPGSGSATEQSIYLYSGQAYSNLGDLSTKYLGNISYDNKSSQIGSSLTTFQLSPKDLSREYYKEPSSTILSELNVLKATPLIEEFWLQNTGYSGDVDLQNCYYLKNIYCAGTPIKNITLPDGGVLEKVQLSSTINSIQIKGHQNLKDLQVLLFRDHDTTADKSNTNKENWSKVSIFSIQNCPSLDTKTIYNQLNYNSLGVYLPDLNWTIDPNNENEGCTFTTQIVNGQEVRIINDIPILTNLVKTRGVAESDGDITALNRTYVAGNIHIKNANTNIGIDEVLLYEKYQKYYPQLTFICEDDDFNIEGFSFNIYSSTSDLLAQYSRKFKDTELTDKFTLAKTFGENEILIPIQSLNLLPRYSTEFVGWNLESRKEFYEDNYSNSTIQENIDEAHRKANEVVAIKYNSDTNTYSINDNFDFATAFNDTDTLNFYPTFVATVQEYEVVFYDGLNNNNDGYGDIVPVVIDGIVQGNQMVRHSGTPIMPEIIPQKLNLLDDVKETRVYEFMNYNQVYTNDNLPVITGATKLKAYYKNTYVHIRTIPSSESYFELAPGGSNGVYIKIANGCDQPALTIPNTYKGDRVIGLMPSVNTVRRIYCMDGNTISIIGDDFKKEDKQFEYFDFAYLRSDNISIGARAFQNCVMLQSDVLPDPMGMIDIKTSAFDGCEKLSISYLPSQLMILENYVFRNCSGITNFSFDNSSNLTKIGRDCFRDCTNLQLIDNSLNNLSIISDYAFRGCSKLNAVIDNTSKITEVGSNAFELSTVTLNALPDSLKKVQADGFAFIASPKTCQIGFIPNTITKIGDRAFSGLTFDVDEVEFDDGITLVKPANDPNAKDIDYGMGASAFSGANIKAIRLPSDAVTTEEPWATGLATSWGATTNGYTKTPIITN